MPNFRSPSSTGTILWDARSRQRTKSWWTERCSRTCSTKTVLHAVQCWTSFEARARQKFCISRGKKCAFGNFASIYHLISLFKLQGYWKTCATVGSQLDVLDVVYFLLVDQAHCIFKIHKYVSTFVNIVLICLVNFGQTQMPVLISDCNCTKEEKSGKGKQLRTWNFKNKALCSNLHENRKGIFSIFGYIIIGAVLFWIHNDLRLTGEGSQLNEQICHDATS